MRILEPSRGHYRKTYPTYKACAFCDTNVLKDQEIPDLETLHWRVIVCKYPYLDGNVIIIPKRHIEHTRELSDQEWLEFPRVLASAQKSLTKIFKTDSFNLGINIGPESGRSIAHLHWMLLPRESRKRNVPVFEALNELVVVTMGYKTLQKTIRAQFKKKKSSRSRNRKSNG